jgi:hypothetical protein
MDMEKYTSIMKGKMVWIAAGLIVIAAIIAAFFLRLGAGGQEHPATLIEAINQVDARARSSDEWVPAASGMSIYGGGQVRTGSTSFARLELLEGVVRLWSESIFTVTESTTRQDSLVTRLFLEEGRLWAHLTTGRPHQFSVETASAVAAVRDTDFSVMVEPDQTTLVSVGEGEVTLSAQGESVTVTTGQQAWVEPDQPPSPPEPMSDAERTLWATEGERPELAPPTPTAEPTPTPVTVEMQVDVYCALHGPSGDSASRDPWTRLEAHVQSREVARVIVETPGGESIDLSAYGDIYGQERRFLTSIQGLPQAQGAYTFTAFDANGAPIPGAVFRDVFLGGHEPDPPSNIQAEVRDDGILVTWEPSPIIPGAFDPTRPPTMGSYQLSLIQEEGGMVYGWNHFGRPWPETSHLIPFRRQDLRPEDMGQALQEMEDGVYYLSLDAFSAAPQGTTGQGLECSAVDPGESVQIVIQDGQPRVE